MTQRLFTLFIASIMLLAACAPSSSPAQISETQAVVQQPVNTSTPGGMTPTSTPPVEPMDASRPTNAPAPEATYTPTMAAAAPLATDTPAPTPTRQIVCDGTLTPAQTEGPYYTPNTPERANLVEAGMGGTPLLVTGQVLNQDCQPIAGAKLDFWQTDDKGEYDNVGYRMRGHQFTDENGNYALETVLPGVYPGRTPHIHVKVFAPDGWEVLTTQIYFAGISDQIPDGIFRADLLARDIQPDANRRRQVAFDFVLPN